MLRDSDSGLEKLKGADMKIFVRSLGGTGLSVARDLKRKKKLKRIDLSFNSITSIGGKQQRKKE